MTSSGAVAKQQPKEISRPDAAGGVVEQKEASAKASANAGLNLNVFGALSGAFSSKSSKKTEQDGSSVEDREENASVSGAGVGNANANAAASAEQRGREMRAAIQEQNTKRVS
ncbi:hypothetical protein DOTSEDRAFT_121804 [Lecanosticta acicola]|uniref:Uncharacterized protein n=1 Tax=Lecanosticta acicola TaxID=111012 RepID=A0AAI8Z459_9PEZI|nr:hypothetical protein DOTSEDRAFT_121804 [Lecanosticta acicola]